MSTEIIGVIITGVVGFCGIIITLYSNARLSRRDQAAQWKHEKDRRDQQHRSERNSLRAGLLAELRTASVYVEMMIDKYANHEAGAVLPSGISDDFYRSSVAQIGLLSESEVREVILAYGGVRLRGDMLKAKFNLDPRFDGLVVVPADKAASEIKSWKNVLELIGKAEQAMVKAKLQDQPPAK